MGRDHLRGVAFEMIRRSVQLLFALTYDRFGASAVLRKRSVLGGSKASASGAGSEGRTDPVAQGLPHDEVEVAALEPRQLLGEQGHALPPGARHPGDVGAPEHSLGTEGVKTALQVRMQAAERVVVLGIACLPRRLD